MTSRKLSDLRFWRRLPCCLLACFLYRRSFHRREFLLCCCPLLRQLFAVEIPNHLRHIRSRFGVWRNAVVLLHALRAGVVGGQRFHHIEVVFFQQLSQIPCPAIHVTCWIKRVRHSQARCRWRHQLHQPLRSFVRHSVRVE